MIEWMDDGQIWIALERSSSESSKDVMSISVSHLIWKEEIMPSKMKYQNQNGRQYGILTQKVAIHTYFIMRRQRDPD
jgi:hypothetical protein